MVKPIGKTQVYEAVYDSMIDSIKTGGWPVGERIPGEIELSEAFQVSRNSVRTAIKVLVSDGVLDCKPGVGTFVTDQALNEIHSRELLSMLQDTQYEAEVTEVRGILDTPDAAEIPQQLFILHGFVCVFIQDPEDHAGDCQPDRAEQQRQDGQQLRAGPLPGKHVVEEVAFGLLRRAVQVQA